MLHASETQENTGTPKKSHHKRHARPWGDKEVSLAVPDLTLPRSA